tara:strand:+ start:435 stop:7256 length:6822 start_codon:yes stop_codon:yes gene_type:complete
MANCKELHKEGTDEYKACVEQNKLEVEEIELDEVVVEGKKQPKTSGEVINIDGRQQVSFKIDKPKEEEKVKKDADPIDTASYLINSLTPFTIDPDVGSFWQDSKNWFSTQIEKTSKIFDAVDKVVDAVGEAKDLNVLENLTLPVEGLDMLDLSIEDGKLKEDIVAYDETYKIIGESLGFIDIANLELKQYNALSDLATDNLIIQRKKDLTPAEQANLSSYMPSGVDIWAETMRIIKRSIPYASQEKYTPVDAAAEALGIEDSGMTSLIADFYGYARNGWIQGEGVQKAFEMFNSEDEAELENTQKFIAHNANATALNYTSDSYIAYTKDRDKYLKQGDGNFWSITKALIKHPKTILTTGIQSSFLNMSNVITSEEARSRGYERALEGAATAALYSKNPYVAVVGMGAGFASGTMEMLELQVTSTEILDELIREGGLGNSILDLSEEEILNLLGDEKKMNDLLKRADDRSKVISAGTFIAAMITYSSGVGLRKLGMSALKTLAILTAGNVVAEGAIEAGGQVAQGNDLNSPEAAEEIIRESITMGPGQFIAGIASVTTKIEKNNIQREATSIANKAGFSFAEIFDGNSTATGVEIINTGFNQEQLQLILNKLVFSKGMSLNESKEILKNFQSLKAFVNKTKPLAKKYNFDDAQIARIADILSEKQENQKLIDQYKDSSPLITPLLEANDELDTELGDIIATVGIAQEGVGLDEVVVTGQKKKKTGYETVQGKKINDLVGPRKENGEYDVTKEEWDTNIREKVIATIFEQELLQGLIASQITGEMERLPNFSREDFISETITELIPHIRNFNPEVNNSLTGWTNSQIINKKKNALKGGKSGTKEKFESSIQSGSVDGKEIQIEDDSTQEGIDAEAQVEPAKVVGDLIADMVGIDSETTEAAADQTIKSPITIEKKGSPNQAVKDVSDIGKVKFYDMIMEAFGGPLGTTGNKIGNFTTFLEVNAKNILKILENQGAIKNKQLSGLYGPRKIDRTTGKFDKGAGKGIFEYDNPNPTAQDLITFLTDPNIGMTTLRNRQEKFADILAGLLNRAKTKELGDTKQGAKVFDESQSIVNPDIPDAVAQILAQIDVVVGKLDAVGKNQLGSGVSPALIANLLSGGLKLVRSGIKGTISLVQSLGRLKRYLTTKAGNADLANIITSYFVDKVTQGKVNEINESSVRQILTEFAVVTGNVNILLTKHKQAKTYDLKSKTSIDNYIADIKENLLPLMPKGFWFGKSGGTQFTGSSKLVGTSINDKKLYKYFESEVKKLNNDKQEFGAPILDKEGKEINFSIAGYSTLFGTPGKAELNIENGKVADFNTKIGLIHKALWKRTFAAIKNNPKEATVIANYMKGVGSNTGHWHKMGAKFAGYSNVMTDGVVFEHAMPATAAYIYLLDAALSGKDFTTEYSNIIKNYKLIALSKKNDNKINKVTYNGTKAWLKTRMNPGWFVETGKWYDRYFNNLVAQINGGIDPDSIIMLDGRTLGETFGIQTSQGRPEAIINDINVKVVDKIAEGQKAVEKNPNLIPKINQDLDKEFNIIIQETKGLDANKKYSDIGARRAGRKKTAWQLFMPAGAQDFMLLMENFLTKRSLGEKQKLWFEKNLLKPYSKGIAKMEIYGAQLKNDFEALKKLFPKVNKILGNEIKGLGYTNDQAIRVYLWDQYGFEVPGISKTDKKKLIAHVVKDDDLRSFAAGLKAISKQGTWTKPSAYWDTGSIVKDINDLSNKVSRKQYLAEFIKNSGIIFSDKNLNKIEAVYGIELRESIEDILYRMKNGTNRSSTQDRLTNAFSTWLNNAVGAIMFVNTRSAFLQLLSMLNYTNTRENNPLAIIKAVLNVKQFSADVYYILNSPKMKKRFAGEGRGVNEAEIASALNSSTNKASSLLAYLLKIGFTPTRAADAVAIGFGGAPYYRNNINKYKKLGYSDVDAQKLAWDDFSRTTDELQQSADPSLISKQQASVLGRFILAFQNTPMQYTRSMIKDGQAFIKRRRIPGLTQSESDRVYIGRIIYYGAVQNFMFAALQNALFALIPGFTDEGEEELDEEGKLMQVKQVRIINSMIDTVLRGSGIYGAIVATLKNVTMKYYQEEGKTPFSKDHRNTLIEILNLSPPIGSKIRKINNALKIKDYDKDVIEQRGWDVTLDGKINLSPSYSVIGNVTEGITNVPLARMVDEVNRLAEMLDNRNSSMQRIALGLGWRTWDVRADNEEHDLIKTEAKAERKIKGIEKGKKTRRDNLHKKYIEEMISLGIYTMDDASITKDEAKAKLKQYKKNNKPTNILQE